MSFFFFVNKGRRLLDKILYFYTFMIYDLHNNMSNSDVDFVINFLIFWYVCLDKIYYCTHILCNDLIT